MNLNNDPPPHVKGPFLLVETRSVGYELGEKDECSLYSKPVKQLKTLGGKGLNTSHPLLSFGFSLR